MEPKKQIYEVYVPAQKQLYMDSLSNSLQRVRFHPSIFRVDFESVTFATRVWSTKFLF